MKVIHFNMNSTNESVQKGKANQNIQVYLRVRYVFHEYYLFERKINFTPQNLKGPLMLEKG